MKKILIIDDEQGIRDMFRFLLERHGFSVFTARDGKEGYELVKNNDYDIVFLDVHMPRMAGPETLARIKEIKPKQTVIIFSSSSDSAYSFEEKALKLGAFACLYKPAVINDILMTIEKANP